MDDAEGVQELDSHRQLQGDLARSLLSEAEGSGFEVVEEVASAHELQDKEELVRVLEEVLKPYDVRVLAHLHHFNLSLNLEDLNRFDVFLSHDLYCYLEAGPFVSR